MDKFIELAYREGRIRKLENIDEVTINKDDYYGIPDIYFSVAESTTNRNYNIGDIVFVPKFIYENGEEGNNHLFVIINKNNIAVSLEYFCYLISSNLNKLKYIENVSLKKTKENGLVKDSLVKLDYIYVIDPDMISFKTGYVPNSEIEFYKKYCEEKIYNEKRVKKYIEKEKSIIEQEYILIEKISKIRKDKKLSQRDLAKLIGIKQPMLANIEKGKNSPQLNTLLNILDSLGYTIEYKEKGKL